MDPLSYAVVIPTYRQPLLLVQAVESAWAQTVEPAEVVVVVDGDAADTLAALASADPRTRIVLHDRNRGQAAARTTGIAATSAPWIAFLDHDDVWHSRKQEAFQAYLQTHPDCAALRCAFAMFRTSRSPGDDAFGLTVELVADTRAELEAAVAVTPRRNDLGYLDIHGDSLRLMLERNRGTTTGSMIRRDVLEAVPAVPEGLSHGEDWLLFTHVAALTEWHLVPERLAFVRLHGSQTTRADNPRAARDLVWVLREMWTRYGGRPGIVLDDYRSEYRALARRWVWDLVRRGRLREATRTFAGFRPLLRHPSDRLRVLVPPAAQRAVARLRRGSSRDALSA